MRYQDMGSARGGARGAMPPPQERIGGPVMHLAPSPNFLGKFCYENTINVVFFFETLEMHACNA